MTMTMFDLPISEACIVVWLERGEVTLTSVRIPEPPTREYWRLRREVYPDGDAAVKAAEVLWATDARCVSVARLIDTLNIGDWPW